MTDPTFRERTLSLVQDMGIAVAPTSTPARDGAQPDPKHWNFEDWSEYTNVANVPYVRPTDANGVVMAVQSAASSVSRARALGHSHNWSPLIVEPGAVKPNVTLIDTSGLVGTPTYTKVGDLVHATFGTGTTLEAATAFLAGIDNGVDPNGYTFLNMPTPGGLTLGGILTVGGHGTSVPWRGMQELDLMGCMSNMIVSFKAVTTEPDDHGNQTYAERLYDRTHPDAPAFLTHLGRAFLTEVTLVAVPNYYLQLTNLFANMTDVMAPPASAGPNALGALLDAHGRVEVIWFPYQATAWVQCNTRYSGQPPKPNGTPVTEPYTHYKWMNGIDRPSSDLIKTLWQSLSPFWLEVAMIAEAADARAKMEHTVLNGIARNLEIYLTDDTLRMTIFGYALQLPRKAVQQAASEFYNAVQKLLNVYSGKPGMETPINGAVEIRCTTLDRQTDLGIGNPQSPARPPALSATHSIDDPNDPNAADTVLWVDLLAFPGTAGCWEFFTDLESWMLGTWGKQYGGHLRPEWSKGFAFTPDGPWTNDDLIKKIPALYDQAKDGLTFQWANAVLNKHDHFGVFKSPFLETLFG